MIQAVLDALRNWNKVHSERAKLQHAYMAMALVVLIVAGVVGLINYNLGQSLLFVSAVLALIFIANSVAWALLQSFVLARLQKRPS